MRDSRDYSLVLPIIGALCNLIGVIAIILTIRARKVESEERAGTLWSIAKLISYVCIAAGVYTVLSKFGYVP